MPSDTSPARPRPGRLTPSDARQRLEDARSSRALQLRALDSGPSREGHLVATQTEANQRVIAEIDAAVARLEAGSYGTCQACSTYIPVERLEILPYTRYCVPCQHRATT
ncbi:TraR/DksA C4-type zinc finger protein [Streptomyces sp. NBC_01232]|uniref:TraR/DksA family transcriptional regulator n=1 Tax=unclassified Streptomyces TaxID=2593676 RepID=UPI002E12ABAF|nr:TraR/DksA C4-type zinc finger protein [Streptomyces sp. NBC_01232]